MGSNTDITADNFTKKMFEGMGMTPHGMDTQVSEYFKQMMVERLQSAFLTKVERYSPLSKKKVGQIKALKQGGFFNRKCKH